jgi:hypothetical protein
MTPRGSRLHWMRAFLRNLVRGQARDADMRADVGAFVELLTDEKIAAGMTPEAARRAARLECGNVDAAIEDVRDIRAGARVAQLWQDTRFAVRMLRREPTFSAVAILTLALGIGANTAIFSLVYQAFLRPLPYVAEDRLVFILNTYPKTGNVTGTLSPPDHIERKTRAGAIEDAAALSLSPASLSGGDGSEQVIAAEATASFFSTLGRAPALGRAFSDEQAVPGNDRFAVLTHALWVSRYGADPAIVGRQIRVNAEPHTVLGVMPPDFAVPDPFRAAAVQDAPSLILPLALTPEQLADTGTEFLVMIARLRPGAWVSRLTAELQTLVAQDAARLPWGIGTPAVTCPRKEIGLRSHPPVVLTQRGEQRRTEGDLAIATALALLDAEHHPLTIDVADFELTRFAAAQASAVEGQQ